MKDEDYKKFFDAIVTKAATEIASSSLVVNGVARRVSEQPEQIATLLKLIDADMLAKAVAEEIVRLAVTNRRSATSHDAFAYYKGVLIRAQERAAELLAENMTKEIMGV